MTRHQQGKKKPLSHAIPIYIKPTLTLVHPTTSCISLKRISAAKVLLGSPKMTQIMKCLASFSLFLSALILSLCSPISSVSLDGAVSSTSSLEVQQGNHLAAYETSKVSFFANRKLIQVQSKRRGRSVRPPVGAGSRTRSSSANRKQASSSQLNALPVFSISCIFFFLV